MPSALWLCASAVVIHVYSGLVELVVSSSVWAPLRSLYKYITGLWLTWSDLLTRLHYCNTVTLFRSARRHTDAGTGRGPFPVQESHLTIKASKNSYPNSSWLPLKIVWRCLWICAIHIHELRAKSKYSVNRVGFVRLVIARFANYKWAHSANTTLVHDRDTRTYLCCTSTLVQCIEHVPFLKIITPS